MTKEYFEDHERKFKQLIIIGDIYARKARFYNLLYRITKSKRAKDRNQYYVTEGQKLLVGGLCVALADIAILTKYMENQGE